MLKAVDLQARVVLKCADLRAVGESMPDAEATTTYEDLETLAPDDQLRVLLAEDRLEVVHCWIEEGP